MAQPQSLAVPGAPARSLYSVVLLAAFSMALSLIVAATTPTTPPAPIQAPGLPATQAGISHDEGWFLFTTADDGSSAIYFIAGNSRHSILADDAQLELQINPLWPTRPATQDELLTFAEGAPIGAARAGLLGVAAPEPPAPAPAAEPEAAPAPAVADDAPSAEDPTPPATDAAPAADATMYTVRPGDSAFKIARRFGVDQSALLEANGISNPNRVYVGQMLTIPS